MSLLGCAPPSVQSPTWVTYQNQRYGFSFPYPSHWQVPEAPSNNDGQVLVNPQNSQVRVQGWAFLMAAEVEALPPPNFATVQGVRGYLRQESDGQAVRLSLTIQRDGTRYELLAQAPQAQFDAYQPYFYYIARQYRLDR